MSASEAHRPGLRKAPDADLHPSTPVDGTPVLGTPAPDPAWLSGRSSTADSVGTPDKDKQVSLEISLPKSLRKAIRQEARRRGMSVDDVVVEALRDRPSR